ncbi:hypothetical protein [Actinoplanes subtropicus]|uniref:hypothetical protein n=1 Tax=Actinoplanes subtropicus TaxID=543632 RepID=UPI0004C35EB9|nr:hypothetical protein [Actinoplanes subtropicus]
MTDFPVKLPYLRSVEVAAAPENARVVLNVYDANQNLVASGEAPIVNWRAKVIFDPPRDVSRFVDSRRYLSADNIFGQHVRVSFTNNSGKTVAFRSGGKDARVVSVLVLAFRGAVPVSHTAVVG